MGSKTASKEMMLKAGVPCVPGYHGTDQSVDNFIAEADKIGRERKERWEVFFQKFLVALEALIEVAEFMFIPFFYLLVICIMPQSHLCFLIASILTHSQATQCF
jgi:hypothetical protein